MTERMANVARHYKECEGIMKAELVKRVLEELQKDMERYRDLCKREDGPELYRNQGKWIVLERIIGNKDKSSIFERIRNDLKKESGSTG